MSHRPTYVDVNNRRFFSYGLQIVPCICTTFYLSIHPLKGTWVDCNLSYYESYSNKYRNTGISLYTDFSSFGHVPGSGIAGSFGNYIFIFYNVSLYCGHTEFAFPT